MICEELEALLFKASGAYFCVVCFTVWCVCFVLRHSFLRKALRSQERKQKDKKKNEQNTCMKHDRKKQSLQQSENKRIISFIEAPCFIEELPCHFVLSQVCCIESIIFKEKVRAFLYTEPWRFRFEHCTRQYHEASIRQVFIYKTELQEIVCLQYYYQSQSMSHCLFSKHHF